MPLLFVVFLVVLVNFSSSVLAQDTTTKLRGPRSTDVPPAPLTLGPLAPSDTLWRVAEQIRPEPDISLYQVMYALYLKNPDAFIEGNLNHLRPGSVLVLPSSAEMRQVDVALARQKSEQDDERWAKRQKPAALQTGDATAEAGKAKGAPTEWQAELQQLATQQKQDLDGLRSQFADSMQLVDTMVTENLELKSSLARLQQELELLKAQLGEDSEIQLQLQQLLQQQQQLLQAKAAEDAAKQAQGSLSDWLSHPLAWVLAACIPALVLLSGVLLWVRKRGRHTEQVVNAATNEAAPSPAYQSPLPPLDDNNDIDESLFEIDDTLLEDAFVETAANNAADDDLLEFDDALSFDDDDSLLPADDALHSDVANKAEPDEFDPDNILSDDDLSALLAAADDDDDVIELADDGAGLEPDELTDEVDFATAAGDSTDELVSDMDSNVDIDELIEEIDLDQADELDDEITQAQQLTDALSKAPLAAVDLEADNEDIDDILSEFTPVAAEISADSPDRSELDAFAQSLIDEMAPESEQVDQLSPDSVDELSSTDEALLSAELSDLLQQADDLLPPEADVNTDSSEVNSPQSDMAQSVEMLAEHPSDADISDDVDAADTHATIDEDILLLDETDADLDDKVLDALDLTAVDDGSVSKLTDAALSVENPSKMLEQYPELELTDDELLSELPDDMLLDELDALVTEPAGLTDQTPELELDPIPEAQFDSLMSELEAMANNVQQAELEQHGADTEQANADLQAELVNPSHNFDDDDFVEIDSLLASAGNGSDDPERFNQLNVDVGLDDYADIIGEHERRDVDIEDNGYSAKLDLVRAYIEIDDTDSAELLLDEILAADAPAHIKTEAQRLKS